MSEGRTAADLIAVLRGRGLKQAEIAQELGRSPRAIRAVEKGEKPGTAYVAALEQLVDKGRLTSPPPRRRNAAGGIVPVRAPRGSTEKTVTPEEPKKPRRGTFAEGTTYLAGGGRIHEVNVPKTGRAGREKGRHALIEKMRSIAKGQAHRTRRVHFRVHLANGQDVPIGDKGGYRVSDVLDRWHGEGDDPLAWADDEIAHRNYDVLMADDEEGRIVTVEIIDPGRA